MNVMSLTNATSKLLKLLASFGSKLGTNTKFGISNSKRDSKSAGKLLLGSILSAKYAMETPTVCNILLLTISST